MCVPVNYTIRPNFGLRQDNVPADRAYHVDALMSTHELIITKWDRMSTVDMQFKPVQSMGQDRACKAPHCGEPSLLCRETAFTDTEKAEA